MTDTDPTLRQCHRDGCTHVIPPPWKRRPGARHDYCSAKCRPQWLRGEDHGHGYTGPRPLDTWVRSGASALQPVPVGPPLPSTVPRYHQVCTDCGTAVHGLHVAHGLCADCVVDHVHKIVEAAEPEEVIV